MCQMLTGCLLCCPHLVPLLLDNEDVGRKMGYLHMFDCEVLAPVKSPQQMLPASCWFLRPAVLSL